MVMITLTGKKIEGLEQIDAYIKELQLDDRLRKIERTMQ